MRRLYEQQYQLKHHLWVIDYSSIFTSWETNLHKKRTVKLFDGYHLIDADPIVTHLCEVLRTQQDYKSLQQNYNQFFKETDEEQRGQFDFDFDRILRLFLQRHIACSMLKKIN